MSDWRQGLTLVLRFLGRGRSRPAAIVLAVAWGTLSMMLLLAFGEGLKRQSEVGRLGLGEDPVILWNGRTTKPWQGMPAGRRTRFEADDVQALLREIPELKTVAGELTNYSVEMRYDDKTITTRITGAPPQFEWLRSHYPQRGGRFFNEADLAGARRVVFLGPEVKERLFGDAEAVGRTVLLQGVPFSVIGVMIDKQQNSSYGSRDVSKTVIPLSTFEILFGKQPYGNLLYGVREGADYEAVERRVREVLGRRQGFDPDDKAALYVWDTHRNRVEGDKIFKGIQAFLGVVGAMTLLVAGVGLANMLFVMVQRRTREIGLQMAIGAHRAAVTAQIVGESLLLAALGGYLGIGLAWLLVELVQRVPVGDGPLQFLGKPTLSLPLGGITVLVLVGIGCLAGSLPARRASRLNPVEALRHE